jgi:lysophospholipase L1-like esterase
MSLAAVACALVAGALTIGTVAGAGRAAPTAAPVFRAFDLAGAAERPTSAPGRRTLPKTAAPASPTSGASTTTAATSAAASPATGAPLGWPVAGAACASAAPSSVDGSRSLVQAAVRPTTSTAATTRPVAAFLGDSYTSGYVGAGIGAAGWPAIVSTSIGLRAFVRAVPGTGFVNPGWTGQPIRTRLAAVIAANPRIVFLAGGHNDRRYATSRSAAAAHDVIARLRRGLPDALIVIVGPIWADGNPPAHIRALRDVLRREARSIGAVFIDPLRDGWFTGSWHRLILSDGIHPSDEGHRRIAKLVLAALRADPQSAALSSAPGTAGASVRSDSGSATGSSLAVSICGS